MSKSSLEPPPPSIKPVGSWKTELPGKELGRFNQAEGRFMATGAQGWIQCALEGCIAAFDSEIRQRPYHRNCSCALHGSCFRSCHLHCKAQISYPIQPSFKPLHLTTSASSFSNSSCCIETSFSCHELMKIE